MHRGQAVVFDAESKRYREDEDELLAAIGFARALGGHVAVQKSRPREDLDDLLDEMCLGLVARAASDAGRICQLISRQLDTDRAYRFEFVTLSPRPDELLAILGDGRSALIARPVNEDDDSSSITSITISEDARSASLALSSGSESFIDAADVARRIREGDTSNGRIPVDGERLGKRIRELRLEAGLTQAELARRTGIHRPNIARVEAGRHTPSLETIARLATAIGVPTTRVLHKD
jgi:DNA-binding XRE family transcriptional regulator